MDDFSGNNFLDMEERLKELLLEGPPIKRFSDIIDNLPDDPVEDVLQALQKYAQLIEGHWVAQTSLLIPALKGVYALSRDYALLSFGETPILTHTELTDRLGSFYAEWKTVLADIADEDASCDWKFKGPKDMVFLTQYPHITEEQRILRNESRKRMEKQMSDLRAAKAAKASSSKKSMSTETQATLKKALERLFETRKVCRFETVCRELRKNAKSEVEAALSDAPREELHRAICGVARYVHGMYIGTSTYHDHFSDKLRAVIVDSFRVIPRNAERKKWEIVAAAKKKLGRTIRDSEFTKVIKEYCVVTTDKAWKLKTGN